MIYDHMAERVRDFAKDNDLPLAYEGFDFKTPSSGDWLELLWEQNGTDERLIQDADSAVEQGFFRVLVHTRPGRGITGIAALANDLIAEIPKGTELGNAYITRQPDKAGPVTDEDRSRLFITTTFRYQTW